MSGRPTTDSEMRDLVRRADRVWGGVIWRLAAIGALLVIGAVAGGVLR